MWSSRCGVRVGDCVWLVWFLVLILAWDAGHETCRGGGGVDHVEGCQKCEEREEEEVIAFIGAGGMQGQFYEWCEEEEARTGMHAMEDDPIHLPPFVARDSETGVVSTCSSAEPANALDDAFGVIVLRFEENSLEAPKANAIEVSLGGMNQEQNYLNFKPTRTTV